MNNQNINNNQNPNFLNNNIQNNLQNNARDQELYNPVPLNAPIFQPAGQNMNIPNQNDRPWETNYLQNNT